MSWNYKSHIPVDTSLVGTRFNRAPAGVNNGLAIGKWKVINKDFTNVDNIEEKVKFEKRILKNIEKLLKK